MKAETTIKEHRQKGLEELATTSDEKSRDYLQGFLAGLSWVLLDEPQEEVKTE